MKLVNYDANFHDVMTDRALPSARVIVPVLLEFMEIHSVLDIGCGQGAWLKTFREHGVERVRGLDGASVDRSRLLIDPACFTAVDLEKCPERTETFDLALCLEVAEHLGARASRPLVRLLTRAAPLVLFSAAVPGQGGIDHQNEQWPEYWRSLFAEHGYRRLDPVRRHIWQDPRVAGWYQQNLFLFASADAIARSQRLQEEEQRGAACDVELISRHVLGRYQTVGALTRELWRAVRRAIGRRFVSS